MKPGVLGLFALRGVFEFFGGLFYLVCLKMAMEYNVNQGVSSCMMSVAGLILTLMSRFMYGEVLNYPQICGISAMLIALPFFGIFSTQHLQGTLSSAGSASNMLKIVAPGLASAFFYAIEAMFIRHLQKKGVTGIDGGFMAIFFNGLYSTSLLIFILTYTTIPPYEFLIIFAAGICTSLGIVLVNFAVERGEAGVAFSIGNSFPCWHSIYCTVVIG